MFSHGYTGTFTDSTFLFEDLASRGYIVFSVAHSGETTAVELPSTRLVTGTFGSYLDPASLRIDEHSIHLARATRLTDLKFVLDALQRMNDAPGPLANTMNLSAIGIMGHSLGGEVALSTLQHDSRVKAAVALDPPIDNEVVTSTNKPVLIIAAARRSWSPAECQLWESLRGPRLLINISWADHFTFSDASWMLGGSPRLTEDQYASTAIHLVRNFIAKFFDQYLNDSSAKLRPYTVQPPSGIAVTTQVQALCAGRLVETRGGVQ